ncbi:MAG TPA: hypothetical protein VFY04_11915 [Solirubrobacterales bacterium]|nr:hypothetical protein [Solirubrobacterales bacterium]
MSQSSAEQRAVFLFSSNSEPLYAQNVLEILATPPGAVKQWRYAEKWVSPEFAEAVRTNQIVGLPVLLHFSLQQRAQLHEPVFLPIRTGTVKGAETVGNGFFVIRVRLEDDAGLRATDAGTGTGEPADGGAAAYKAFIAELGVPHPYKVSASIGPILPPEKRHTTGGRESGLFENNVAWLAKTETFRAARFFRFYRLVEHGGREEIAPDEEGSFCLRAGRTYELELFLFQPERVERETRFEIFSDEVSVSVIGRRSFDVASRYDLVRVPLAVSLPTDVSGLKTFLTVAPEVGAQGPKLELPLEVRASKSDRAVTVGGSALTLLFLAAQALVTGAGAKVGLLVAAVLLGTFLAWRNRPIGPLAGGMRPAPTPYPPAPDPAVPGHKGQPASHIA